MQCSSFQTSEQLHEDDQVQPKHVAVGCNFNVILNWESVNRDTLKAEVNVKTVK
jgi:hypothetical protein